MKELVTKTLNGILDSLNSFAVGICARKEVPKFEELWINYTQEESRFISKGNIQIPDKGNSQAYTKHFKKGGGRKKFCFQRRNEGRIPKGRRPTPQGKRDMLNVQCYQYHKYGHFRHELKDEMTKN